MISRRKLVVALSLIDARSTGKVQPSADARVKVDPSDTGHELHIHDDTFTASRLTLGLRLTTMSFRWLY
jgi:hypothetical protein